MVMSPDAESEVFKLVSYYDLDTGVTHIYIYINIHMHIIYI